MPEQQYDALWTVSLRLAYLQASACMLGFIQFAQNTARLWNGGDQSWQLPAGCEVRIFMSLPELRWACRDMSMKLGNACMN